LAKLYESKGQKDKATSHRQKAQKAFARTGEKKDRKKE
jgi:hypothetical protein